MLTSGERGLEGPDLLSIDALKVQAGTLVALGRSDEFLRKEMIAPQYIVPGAVYQLWRQLLSYMYLLYKHQ